MKPKEQKPSTVFRIVSKENGVIQGSYSRAYCDEYDFTSVSEARNANCNGIFKNRAKYKIAKYKVTYELIDDDVDPASPEEIAEDLQDKEIELEMDRLNITDTFERVYYIIAAKEKLKKEI